MDKYSNTVTVYKEGNEASRDDKMPQHIVVTMILNEVNNNSVDGGALGQSQVRREKPEFIVATNSNKDLKKVMNIFKTIFTTDKEKCRRDEFDVTCLRAEKDDNKMLANIVDKYINEKKG